MFQRLSNRSKVIVVGPAMIEAGLLSGCLLKVFGLDQLTVPCGMAIGYGAIILLSGAFLVWKN